MDSYYKASGGNQVAALISAIFILAVSIIAHGQPKGNEFLVNSTTANHQRLPDVAMDAQGNFVVVFENTLPVTTANVSAQRYSSTGNRIGGEFQVNTTAFSDTTLPAVAMNAAGDFVVVWQDFGDDGSGFGIYAQRYNSLGQAQGPNVLVNTTTDDAQRRADVDMNDNKFVVVWEDDTAGNGKRGIRGQRFDTSGVRLGGEFDISTNADIDHTYPKVAVDAAGGFVVGWSSGNVGANQNVVFRRFNQNGAALGQPVQVNVTSKMDSASGVVNNMSIDSDGQGNFIVVWRADNFSGPGVPGQIIGILARRYDNQGNALNAPFVVNTDNPSSSPEVAMASNGQFAITYEAPDGSLSGVFAKIYNAEGGLLEASVRYNSTTSLQQGHPAIALDGNGKGVVTWRATNNQDGDRDGIYARLLAYESEGFSGNNLLRIVCIIRETCRR